MTPCIYIYIYIYIYVLTVEGDPVVMAASVVAVTEVTLLLAAPLNSNNENYNPSYCLRHLINYLEFT